MFDEPEWITANEAKQFVEKRGFELAEQALAERAAAGMIRSRASAYYERIYDRPSPAFLPTDFWTFYVREGGSSKNWSTGDFAVRTPELRTLKALGVSFKVADLKTAFSLPKPTTSDSLAPSRPKGGRPPYPWWDDLWIEICCQLYDGRLKPDRQSDIEKAMLDWLAQHELDASEGSIRRRAQKLFRELGKEDKNPG